MIKVIPFESLGHAKHGWLNARHHFSFARYYDPERMGYPPLVVWNDDEIKPKTGFGKHPHDNMEIITYVRQGAITHQDSMGNVGRTEAGDVQAMSAGTGVFHSEHNEEEEETVLFQIWIQSADKNVEPRWEARAFPKQSNDVLVPLVSGRDMHKDLDTLMIYQDAAIFAGTISAGKSYVHPLEPGRHMYLVPSKGEVSVNGEKVNARDGVYIQEETELRITATADAEIVLADLPVMS
ncbi:MAG: pirin family protein [Candidatus Marinimicrobia bacterium]|nr:pirin family protein [Candidatus Neomarinimicrobiota bacterium]MCF7904460.1 pirin family protein [Candidatus Neomarinimicrobiota bacterium]